MPASATGKAAAVRLFCALWNARVAVASNADSADARCAAVFGIPHADRDAAAELRRQASRPASAARTLRRLAALDCIYMELLVSSAAVRAALPPPDAYFAGLFPVERAPHNPLETSLPQISRSTSLCRRTVNVFRQTVVSIALAQEPKHK